MLNPGDRTTGRGLLLFGALLLLLSGFLAVRGAWRDAALWCSVAVFAACYGAVQLDLLPRWRKVWLGVGLVAGVAAFVIALGSALVVGL